MRKLVLALTVVCLGSLVSQRACAANAPLATVGRGPGVCAVVGLSPAVQPSDVIRLAQERGWTVYVQSPVEADVAAVRQAAREAGVLGRSVFVDRGSLDRIHLAANLADVVLADSDVLEAEVLRALRPGGRGLLGDAQQVVKPSLAGIDAWTHPFHGPDNNPVSTDQLARAPYLTQFIAAPQFSPLPTLSVAAGGRVFRAHGHIAFKRNQVPMLNTLVCSNGYNGTILWTRPLREGYIIHRMCLVATESALYLADDQSCKVLDAATGRELREFIIPEGPVWKWLALEGDTLYALVGGSEARPKAQRGEGYGLGHWPWGMWEGFAFNNPATNVAFGQTLVALDPHTGQRKWTRREQEYLDGRAVCLKNGRLYYYAPHKFLACLNAVTGDVVWKNTDETLLAAIGADGRAQTYTHGYSTTCYAKCDEERLYFAGPQRPNLVVASARDGHVLWQRPDGNYHLLLRPEALYGIGREPGFKADYATGQIQAAYPNRRACTRATSSVDALFYRASGGTIRVDLATDQPQHLAPMRPPCMEGVVIAGGMLYWGPWMCGCQLSLYGHIGVTSGAGFDYLGEPVAQRLTPGRGDTWRVEPLPTEGDDWPTYQGDSANRAFRATALPRATRTAWSVGGSAGPRITAPVVAGGMVFIGDRAGSLWGLDAKTGEPVWQRLTGGAVFYPPTLSEGRAFVGSADGRVYAFEAATGRPLWTFRVAPTDRWIPVNGQLMSTWPVAGGVVVKDGTVYAAAGIAHYDGTHVVALEAVTGRVRWYNNTSGITSPQFRSGVSLQGSLLIRGNELCFPGGGLYALARYDLATGECLNPPATEAASKFATAFEALYPEYGQYVTLDHTFADGTTLSCQVAYDGAFSSSLALLKPSAAGAPPLPTNWRLMRGRWKPKTRREAVWDNKQPLLLNAFVVTPQTVLCATRDRAGHAQLQAFHVADGKEVWQVPLPAPVVRGGLALAGKGSVFASLQDGQLLCLREG